MRTTTEATHESTEADTYYGTPHARKTATEAQRAFWAGYDAAILDVEEADNKYSHWAD